MRYKTMLIVTLLLVSSSYSDLLGNDESKINVTMQYKEFILRDDSAALQKEFDEFIRNIGSDIEIYGRRLVGNKLKIAYLVPNDIISITDINFTLPQNFRKHTTVSTRITFLERIITNSQMETENNTDSSPLPFIVDSITLPFSNTRSLIVLFSANPKFPSQKDLASLRDGIVLIKEQRSNNNILPRYFRWITIWNDNKKFKVRELNQEVDFRAVCIAVPAYTVYETSYAYAEFLGYVYGVSETQAVLIETTKLVWNSLD
ncbi:MAG: hypothetical protein ACFFG0_16540 [Candidatus Thorarchaeota archaeon]